MCGGIDAYLSFRVCKKYPIADANAASHSDYMKSAFLRGLFGLAIAWAITPSALAELPRKVAPGAIGASVPIHPERWVTTADRLASGSDGEGITRFELTISSVGDVRHCDVTQSSGYAVLDQLTCSLLQRRGHFVPAHDEYGQVIASTWRNLVRWVKPENAWQSPPPPLPPDLELVVTQLPPKFKSPVRIRISAISGINGDIEACSGEDVKSSDVLNKIACQQLDKSGLLADFQKSHAPSQRIMRTYIVQFLIDPGANKQ